MESFSCRMVYGVLSQTLPYLRKPKVKNDKNSASSSSNSASTRTSPQYSNTGDDWMISVYPFVVLSLKYKKQGEVNLDWLLKQVPKR
ncbi:hypothetical protein SAMN05421790_101511 [Kroppenstedtia eburnea]|uniref:Uncharacterized protein n=1 Tax=Kroppenstedtia eburnea TaxID=714067 RepID=A0A1N7IYH5_9BACL|nr:hypothetical protein SAMN05421790_101511 [Kroppenstedtia eburnea]